jgi:hypothetical protein
MNPLMKIFLFSGISNNIKPETCVNGKRRMVIGKEKPIN